MSAMTYETLTGDIRRYLERGFTEESDPYVYEQIPSLIRMSEVRCGRELKIQGFIRAITTTLVSGDSVLRKPDRWRETVSMTVNGQPIFSRSYEYIKSYWPDSEEIGAPEYYSDYDFNHWIIAPTASESATLEVVYYEQPAFLSDSNQTNWLTDYAPDLLLYGALLEAEPFLKNDSRIGTWQSLYDRALSSLSGEDKRRISDRSADRKES